MDCFNSTTKPKNYFLNYSEKYYEPCYETCSKCEYGGDKINNNCIECEFGFIFKPGVLNTSNCITKCPYYFYYTIDGQYKCSRLTICPERYYLLIKEKDQCIEDCKKDDDFKYQYNGECLRECPDNSNDNKDYMCRDNNINICSLSIREIQMKNEIITEEEIEELAKTYFKEFFYTDNHISIYNYYNYIVVIYKNGECIDELSLEIPKVDLGECYEKIKEKYAITQNLILVVVAKKEEEMKYPIIVNFYVFSPYNGNKLDIEKLCENSGIQILEKISIKIGDKEKYNLVQYLANQNIDAFDLSSDFYMDICYNFDSPIKKDIALKDRIKLFYPNITLCENGCNIKGINTTTMKAKCECKVNNIINNNILANNAWYKNQMQEIEDLLNESNLEILKCTSKVFKYGKLTSFIDSIIVLSLIIFQIALVFIYCIISIKQIREYIFYILNIFLDYNIKKKNDPPNRISHKSKSSRNKGFRKSSDQKKLNIINSKDKVGNTKKKKLSQKNFLNLNNSSGKISIINNNTKDVYDLSNQLRKTDGLKINNKLRKKSRIGLRKEFKIKIEDYLETELEEMAFEEVKERDTRKFKEYFVEQIKTNLLILNIALNQDPFKPRTIRIILFIINIDLYLFINALFINEEFISDVFNSHDDNFFSFLPRCID